MQEIFLHFGSLEISQKSKENWETGKLAKTCMSAEGNEMCQKASETSSKFDYFFHIKFNFLWKTTPNDQVYFLDREIWVVLVSNSPYLQLSHFKL